MKSMIELHMNRKFAQMEKGGVLGSNWLKLWFV